MRVVERERLDDITGGSIERLASLADFALPLAFLATKLAKTSFAGTEDEKVKEEEGEEDKDEDASEG